MINPHAALPEEIFATLPGREAVLNHTVSVDTDRWNREIAARQMAIPEYFVGRTGRMNISRTDLLALGAADPTAEKAMELLIGALAWGLGLRASRLTARLDALAGSKDAAERLLAAWICVREEQPADEAYKILTTERGTARIPWLGPAFSTKFLYFAQGLNQKPRHLILDKVIATKLRPFAWPDSPTTAWWPSTYAKYCTLMGNWALQASDRTGREVSPDEIELTVFNR
ncbi:8-oxoguanine DNA glycosylase OGG fold protein [Arthrobacter rhombi]|uniref:8-oxoguanine DNA glycosylase OGG fold protein n=1 Tax=Arthrobacter rhombi TaxID=71253 RepID=UPI003FD1CBC6